MIDHAGGEVTAVSPVTAAQEAATTSYEDLHLSDILPMKEAASLFHLLDEDREALECLNVPVPHPVEREILDSFFKAVYVNVDEGELVELSSKGLARFRTLFADPNLESRFATLATERDPRFLMAIHMADLSESHFEILITRLETAKIKSYAEEETNTSIEDMETKILRTILYIVHKIEEGGWRWGKSLPWKQVTNIFPYIRPREIYDGVNHGYISRSRGEYAHQRPRSLDLSDTINVVALHKFGSNIFKSKKFQRTFKKVKVTVLQRLEAEHLEEE